MEKLREMYERLREGKGYSIKKVASDLKINELTFKSYLYKGGKSRNPKMWKRIMGYFEKELASCPEKTLPEKKELTGIRKGLRDLLLEVGKGDLAGAVRNIKRDLNLPNSSFNNWYWQGIKPKEGNLKRLTEYFTKKLQRPITPECILGEEIKKEEKPMLVEEKPKEKPKPIEEKAKEKLKPEDIDNLIEGLKSLQSELKEKKETPISDEEKGLIAKFRKLSLPAKQGLMMFLK
ncbi:MAG: hypothetical protein AB1595_03400 [bacterium]